MENDILRFGLVTPSLVIKRDEMPRARIINLIMDHVPDDSEAGEAIEMLCIASSGQYEGRGWSIWFSLRGETFH